MTEHGKDDGMTAVEREIAHTLIKAGHVSHAAFSPVSRLIKEHLDLATPPSPDARVEELERALRAIGSTDTYTTADGKDQTAGLMRKMARAALAKPEQ